MGCILSGDYGITTWRLQGYSLFIRGCTTYRKTLVGKGRGISTTIKAQKDAVKKTKSKFTSALTLEMCITVFCTQI